VRDLLTLHPRLHRLFCFNHTSAIGAIRAIQDAGLTCPPDISVIGFDWIIVAEYFNPRLTAVRQPLYKWAPPPQSSSSSQFSPPTSPIPTTSALSQNSS
jgi:DNA-binding LacI/PurR family transcriptional regulator